MLVRIELKIAPFIYLKLMEEELQRLDDAADRSDLLNGLYDSLVHQ